MSKKGFTLIEMLIVIAVIAVLVAIILPSVLQSNIKAKAAADAANLRSVIAEATISMQADLDFENTATGNNTEPIPSSWYSPVTSESGDGDLHVVINSEGRIIAYFGNPKNNVAHYSELAGL